MSELSPAAQAVFDATFPVYDDEILYVAPARKHASMIAAAALRATVDQPVDFDVPFYVVDDWEKIKGSCASFYAAAEWGYKQALKEQRAIADELEAQ